jgi:hypothetical protein
MIDDPLVNFDAFPLSPSKAETLPTDETHQEAKLPGHKKISPTK